MVVKGKRCVFELLHLMDNGLGRQSTNWPHSFFNWPHFGDYSRGVGARADLEGRDIDSQHREGDHEDLIHASTSDS